MSRITRGRNKPQKSCGCWGGGFGAPPLDPPVWFCYGLQRRSDHGIRKQFRLSVQKIAARQRTNKAFLKFGFCSVLSVFAEKYLRVDLHCSAPEAEWRLWRRNNIDSQDIETLHQNDMFGLVTELFVPLPGSSGADPGSMRGGGGVSPDWGPPGGGGVIQTEFCARSTKSNGLVQRKMGEGQVAPCFFGPWIRSKEHEW